MQTQKRPRFRPPRTGAIDGSVPIKFPNREQFAQMVANMVPVAEAYRAAGYTGNDHSRSVLRRSADIDARISWILADRVDQVAKSHTKGQKKIEDARLRLIRELEHMAYSTVDGVVAWDRKPIFAEDGSITGYADELQATPSRKLKPEQLAAIKSVTTKSGNLKLEFHDKNTAIVSLAKVLGLTQDVLQQQNVTVNQVNIGETPALEAARRLAFLLAKAPDQPLTIEHQPTKTGETSK